MELAGTDCEVLVTNVDEPIIGDAETLVRELSLRKNQAACDAIKGKGPSEDCIVISADTLVSIKGKVLEKPSSHEEAFEMLKKLSGNKHTVYTGVTITKLIMPKSETNCHVGTGLASPEKLRCNTSGLASSSPTKSVFVESADVFFRELTDDEINAYIKTGEPFDKAGAYGVQEKGALLVEKVHGDFYTVVGLPIMKVGYVLGQMGVDIWRT